MLCKIAERPETATAIEWKQVTRSGQNVGTSASSSGTTLQVAELERRLSELQATNQVDVNKIRQAAYQDGLREGREQSAMAARDCTEKLGATVAELTRVKAKLRNDAEREVVKLSIAIARRILNRELAVDPDALHGVVHAALSKLQARDILQIRVSAQAVDALKAYIEQAGVSKAVKVVADSSLQVGDLVVDSIFGELDASVNTQLSEIERGFADRLAG